MRKYSILFIFLLAGSLMKPLFAQELYVYSEPASNMPAQSLGLRLTTEWATEGAFENRTMAELMLGLNKNLMLHGQVFFSNINQHFRPEGASIYAKYRFLSIDDAQSHFRAAAFGRLGISRQKILTDNINLEGGDSGWQSGLVFTQLLHKLALSLTLGYNQELSRLKENHNPLLISAMGYKPDSRKHTLNYSLSSGYLLLPFVYKNYKQPNFNVYLDLLGETNPETKRSYLDLAPAVQLIINSKTRIDAGYRLEIANDGFTRDNKNMLLVRVEFNFFNALSKKQ